MNVIALTMAHDRILHEGAKRCEGTSTLYTVGCQGSLRAARPESVTVKNYTIAKLVIGSYVISFYIINYKVSVGLLRALITAILWLFISSIILLVSLIILFNLLNISLNFRCRISNLLIYLLLNFVTWFKPQ